jgi:hypothetical protein
MVSDILSNQEIQETMMGIATLNPSYRVPDQSTHNSVIPA